MAQAAPRSTITTTLVTLSRALWPVLLGIGIFMAIGGLGFNPSDEGLVNAAASRVLQGQVPHTDFIWPRPVGSAYLHLPELLLPTPMVLTSRAVALAELVAYSLLFGALVIDRSSLRWTVPESLAVATSVLVSMHAYPLMAWYTVDGLLFIGLGAVLLRWALRRSSLAGIAIAFLALGIATTFKQSFWPAPVFGLIWLVIASPRSQWLVRAAAAVAAAALPGILYVGAVVLSGGMAEMITQLGSGEPVIGEELVEALDDLRVIALLVAGAGAFVLHRMLDVPRFATWPRLLRLVPLAVVATLLIGAVVAGGMGMRGSWGIVLWCLVVLRVAVDLAFTRRWDWPGMVLIGTGWMVTLSWGAAVPNLLSGSLALFVLYRARDETAESIRWRQVTPFAVASLLFALGVVPTFAIARTQTIYRDRPASALTVDLGTVHPEMAGVMTNPVTAAYLEQLEECVESHPAGRVAALPDNAYIYPLLGLRNPLPIDWIIPADITGSEDRIVAAAREIDRAGDYLVLFQTVSVAPLATFERLEPAADGGFREPALGARIRESFSGPPVSCGVFEGFWSP
ncbi:MAG: hypothetical protein ACRDGV_04680 [Candidatus Limnocylindria bacterium]